MILRLLEIKVAVGIRRGMREFKGFIVSMLLKILSCVKSTTTKIAATTKRGFLGGFLENSEIA